MKTKLSLAVIVFAILYCDESNAQTNKSLSNLTSPTAINQTLLPDVNNSKDLGSSSLAWKNLYFSNRIYLDKKITLHAPGTGNFFAGSNAGTATTTGINNTGTGNSSLYNNTSGRDNTAGGYISLYMNTTGSFNAANGTWTLYNNISGNNNTAQGYSALWQNQTGSDNTAIGKYSMYSNVKGFSNVALGTMALFRSIRNNNTVAIGDSTLYNFTGDLFSSESYTTAIGSKALFSNISGYENTAIGTRAMYNTTKGSINTAVGVSALFQNSEGVFNTAMGVTALSGNTTGDYNTGIGYSTLQINETGNQNTAIGAYAGPNSFDLVSNSTSIGYLSRATASNQVRLGSTSVTSIGGQVGWTTFSDGRFKKNIKENVPGLAFINALKPVTYNVDTKNLHSFLNKKIKKNDKEINSRSDVLAAKAIDEAGEIIYDGFVAQEVEEAAKRLGFEFSGVDKPKNQDDLYGLRYDNFVVPLVKAVQELSKLNQELKEQNEEQEKRIERLESFMNVHAGNSSQTSKNIVATVSALEQNIPNPFTNTTTIHYTLLQKFTTAQIIINDKNGNVVKQAKISAPGNGLVKIEAAAISSGAYTYSLIVDGKIISTKQMMLIK